MPQALRRGDVAHEWLVQTFGDPGERWLYSSFIINRVYFRDESDFVLYRLFAGAEIEHERTATSLGIGAYYAPYIPVFAPTNGERSDG